MSSREYYNSIVAITDIFYESHKILIEKICIELEQTDRVDELIETFLDKSIKLKHKRDPNKPKRPKNSYTYFCKDFREKVKKDNPESSFKDINKLLGVKWKNLSQKTKQHYIKLGELDKNRYQDDMEDYENKVLHFD